MAETDVAAVALAALASQWADHWVEVPSLTGRVDIVGRDAGGGLHAVEVKQQPSLALAGQAMRRMQERAFATVLVVFGQKTAWRGGEKSGVADMLALGLALGFGVAFVCDGKFRLELPPQPLVTEPPAVESVARALNDIHKQVSAAAGSSASRYWTLWKQGIHEMERAVAAEPGIKTTALRWKLTPLKVLYWSNHNAQVRTMAEQSAKVRIEQSGREYAYFPA